MKSGPMTNLKRTCLLMVAATVGFMPLAAEGAKLPSNFTLSKAIPADAWMLVHGVNNPDRKWIDDQWNEVWTAFHESGVIDEIFATFSSELSAEDKAQVDQLIATVHSLIAQVDWEALGSEEVVFAECLTPPIPSYYALARGAKNSGEANANGLVSIAKTLCEMSGGKLSIAETEIDGTTVWHLVLPEQAAQLEYSVSLFRKGDVIGLVAGTKGVEHCLNLMAGKEPGKSIIDTPRFKQALKDAKAPKELLSYFDFKMLVGDIRGMIDFAIAKSGKADQEPQERAIIMKVINVFDILDYQISTVQTDGRFERTHQITRLQKERMNDPIVKMIVNRKPFEPFDRFIPKEATAFSASSTIDLQVLYHFILDFVEKELPDGREAVADVKQAMAEMAFDPDRDIFSWLSGEVVSVTMPAAVATPMSPTDSVLMVRIKDAELAKQKIDSGLAMLMAVLPPDQQITVMPVTVAGVELKRISHPMMAMMMINPVIGCTDEWIVIATSDAAVGKCLDVAAGKSPSMRDNPRFKEEAVMPKGKVMGASFSDISNMGQEMSQAIGMLSMFGGMGMAAIPDDEPDAKEIKKVMGKVFNIMMKLAPVLAKIDFYSSQSGVMTMEGNIFKMETVIAYKPKQ